MNEPTIFEAHSSYVLELLFTRNSQTLVLQCHIPTRTSVIARSPSTDSG